MVSTALMLLLVAAIALYSQGGTSLGQKLSVGELALIHGTTGQVSFTLLDESNEPIVSVNVTVN